MGLWRITDKSDSWLTLEDPEGWWSAFIRWDGCIDLARVFNLPLTITRDDPTQLSDSLHICDIDETIERLQTLKSIAKSYFQSVDNGEEYWNDA